MRKLLVSMLVIGAVSFSAGAQAQAPLHGLKTGYVAATYTGEVLPGQMDNFKQLVSKVVAATAQKPGTLMYEWTFRPDGKTFDVLASVPELRRRGRARQARPLHLRQRFGTSTKGCATGHLRLAG